MYDLYLHLDTCTRAMELQVIFYFTIEGFRKNIVYFVLFSFIVNLFMLHHPTTASIAPCNWDTATAGPYVKCKYQYHLHTLQLIHPSYLDERVNHLHIL